MTLGNLLLKSSPQNCSDTVTGSSTIIQRLIATLFVGAAFLLVGGQDLSAQCSISPTGGANVSQDFTTSNVGSCVDVSEDNLSAVGITAGVESSPPDSCFIYWRNPDVAGTGLDTLVRTDSVIVCCNVAAAESDMDGNLILPPGTYILYSDDDGVFDDSTAQDSVIYTINLIDNGSPTIDSCQGDTTLYAGPNCTALFDIPVPEASDNCMLDSVAYSFAAGSPAPDSVCPPMSPNKSIGFQGAYSPMNWTFSNSPSCGNGTVDESNAPTSITLTSSNNSSCSGDPFVSSDYCITIPEDGTLEFDWDYSTNDLDGPAFDPFGYRVNGTFTKVTNDGGADNQSGTVSIPLQAGDEFCLTIQALDDIEGAAVTVAMNFMGPGYSPAGDTTAFGEGILSKEFFGSTSTCEAVTIVTQTVYDASGNSSSCSFAVTVVDTTDPVWSDQAAQMMSYPDDPGGNYTTMYDAMGGVGGGPSVTVMTEDTCTSDAFTDWDAWMPVAEDNCDTTVTVTQVFDSITYNFDSVDQGPPCVVYERIQYFEAMDICDSTTIDSFTLVFQIKDTEAPVFASDIVTDTTLFTEDFNPDSCNVDVCASDGPYGSVIGVSASDCIALVDSNYTWTISGDNADMLDTTEGTGPDACMIFPPGDYTITYTATDPCGQSSSIDIALSIVDNTAPSIANCPANDTISTLLDNCFQVYSWIPPTAMDNCDTVTRTTMVMDEEGNQIPFWIAGGAFDITGFAGYYTPSNWSVNQHPDCSNGTVDASGAPDSIVMTSTEYGMGPPCSPDTMPPSGGPVGYYTDYCITIPVDGTLHFDWDYETDDIDGPALDPFGYIVNDNWTQVTNDGGPDQQSGSESISLQAGDEFCFSIVALDGIFGASVSAVMNFEGPGAGQGDTTKYFAALPKGTNTIQHKFYDLSANADTCEFTVEVEDNQAPEIIACAGDQFFASICDSVQIPDYRGQIAYNENCNEDTIYQDPAPGTYLIDAMNAQGDTLPEDGDTLKFTFVIEDCGGNTDTCMNTVELQDNDEPIPTEIPLDATIDMDDVLAAGCGEVTIPVPTATDCNGCIIYATTSAGNGAIYNPGVLNPNGCDSALVHPSYTFYVQPGDSVANFALTWFYDDGNGNIATQTQQIVVMEDFKPPVVDCPQDQTIGTGEDGDFDCDVVPNDAGYDISVQYVAPELPYPPGGTSDGEFTDNCDPDPTVEYSISGATTVARKTGNDAGTETFNQGLSTVTYYVTDNVGNSSSCSFTVDVPDDQAPMVTCPLSEVTLNTGDMGDAISGDCAYTVSDSTYDPSNILDNCAMDTVYYEVSGTTGGLIVNPSSGTTLDGTVFDLSASPNSMGSATIQWYVIDSSGNTSQCTTFFQVNDDEDPVVTCPADVTVGIGEDGDSTDCIYTVQGTEFDPDTSDNCMVVVLDADVPEDVTLNNGGPNGPPEQHMGSLETLDSAQFPIGVHNITWTVFDKKGNSSTCTFTVTVVDDVDPVFTYCPADDDPRFTNDTITLPNITGECFTSLLWARPDSCDIEDCPEGPCMGDVTITEMISDPTVQAQVDANFPYDDGNLNDTAYAQFPVGVTEVKYTATDAFGNSATCAFYVNVIDTMPPSIVSCVADQELPFNCPEGLIPNYTFLGLYADNCEANNEELTVTQSPAPGTTLGSLIPDPEDGDTLSVTITVTDKAGNSTTCEFTVTVNEGDTGEPPVPTIAGASLPQDSTDCGSLIVDAPTATDCGDTIYGIANQGQYLGNNQYLFTTGTYLVIWTYIDNENNTSAQSQLIIVEDDTIPPTLTCTDYTVNLDANGEGSITVANVLDTATDNCTPFDQMSKSLSDSTFDCTDAVGTDGSGLVLSAVYDGDLPGGEPKGVELYVTRDISDLSDYGVGTANNGGGSDGEEFTFPSGSASQGQYIYIVAPGHEVAFNSYFGFDPDYTSGAMFINGDDAVELFWNGEIIDLYGQSSYGGSPAWDHGDGWAYRNSFTGPNGGTFDDSNWTIEQGAYDGASDNSEGDPPMPIGTFTTPAQVTGSVPVTITVTDEFGNSSTCEVDVTVVDNTAPTAECQDITVVLDSDGEASISDQAIDDGSTDNCSIDSYNASQTEFDCSDVGDNDVTLTVTDPSGNVSTCVATVTVQDNEAPTAQCQDITVALTGNDVTVNDDAVDDGSTDNCGVGSYSLSQTHFTCSDVGDNPVTLTVTDVNGNTASCDATITIVDNTAPTITCSEDIASCVAEQTVTASASDACGIASVTWQAAGATDTSGTGEIVSLKFNPGVTTVTWTATDVNGNSSTCSTEVDITDSEAPTAVCIDDINTSIGSDGTVTIPAEVFDGGSFDNGCTPPEPLDFQIEVNGQDPVDAYTFDCTEMGQNDVKLVVTDAACNTAICWTTITIQDHVDPTAVCISDTFEMVIDNGPDTLDPANIDDGSLDNNYCSDISLSVNPSVFDESDMGFNDVTLTVTDSSGNTATCVATIEVTVPPTTLSGNVSEEDGDAVADVTVNISGDFSGSTTTDGSGDYSLGIPTGSDITVTPTRDIDYTEGVSTADLIMIQQHILALDTLDSPYKLIAADASNNAFISTFDLVQLQSLIVGNISELPSNDSWRFVDEDYVFPDPTDPWTPPFPESLDLTMNSDVNDADFIGIKIGDVFDNSAQGGGSTQDRATILFESKDASVKTGETVEVDVRANDFDALLGYQSTMEFDRDKVRFEETRLSETLTGLTENNFGKNYLEKGQLIFNWFNAKGQTVEDGEVLFTIVFKAVSDVDAISETITLSDAVLTSEAYTNTETMNLGLTFRDVETTEAVFELYQNIPNPFRGETTIGFVLPEATDASLKIYDATGRLIKEVEGEYNKGYNEERVSLDNITQGVLYYQLSTDKHSAVKQMIIAE